MPPRLVDTYPIGAAVEITFDGDRWIVGVIARHDHPGVWVQTSDGRLWFVTNTRHIRKGKHEAPPHPSA